MEFLNENDYNNINLFINTNEDTIDITIDTELEDILDNISDAVDNDIRINDIFNGKQKSSNTDLDDVLEQAVINFKKTNCDEYFNIIYNNYSKIIKNWSIRSCCQNYDVAEELYSDVMGIVLLNAVNAWEPTGGAKFNTYLWTCIKFHMTARKKKKNAKKRISDTLSKSLNETNSCNKEGVEMTIESVLVGQEDVIDENFEIINAIESLKSITDRNKKILKMIVLGYRYEDISKEIGITGPAAKLFLKRFGTTYEGRMLYKLLKN